MRNIGKLALVHVFPRVPAVSRAKDVGVIKVCDRDEKEIGSELCCGIDSSDCMSG